MLFAPAPATHVLGMNEFDGIVYVNRERLESALYWITLGQAMYAVGASKVEPKATADLVHRWFDWSRDVLAAAQEAGYRVSEIEQTLFDEAAIAEAERISRARASRRDP